MGHYWEYHKKKFFNARLAWHGEAANEEFWFSYWQQKLTKSYYEQLKTVKLDDSILGKALLNELLPFQNIIEAGCGAGNYVEILNNYGYNNIQGIDYSQELMKHINNINPNLNVRWGDALNVESADCSFDGYLSFGVVEHNDFGPEPFLKEAYRILKPGGKIIITVPCVGPLRKLKALLGFYRDNINDLPFFQYGFQKEELASLLESNGFKVQDSKYIELDRLIIEEFFLYRKLSGFNFVRIIQKKLARLLEGFDGHMLLITGRKHESGY